MKKRERFYEVGETFIRGFKFAKKLFNLRNNKKTHFNIHWSFMSFLFYFIHHFWKVCVLRLTQVAEN